MEVKVGMVGTYNGHSLKQSGSVDLTFKCPYSELTEYIKSIQMLNNDVSIMVKLAGEKPLKLGMFRIKEIRVDGDGEGTLKFNSINDYVEVNNLNKIITKEPFKIRLRSDVEIEEEEENEEE